MPDLVVQTLLMIPVLILNGWLTIKLYHWNNKRRDKKFLRHLIVDRRGATTITMSVVGPNEAETLDKMKEQLDASA